MKQGTVTIDINDYDKMFSEVKSVVPKIEFNDDKLKVVFPQLTDSIIEQINKQYPDYKIDYWNNYLTLTFTKQDSNE